MSDPVSELAARLISARRTRSRFHSSCIGQALPDMRAAYAVQDTVQAAMWPASGRPRCWKVGAASRDALPTAAPLPDPLVHENGAALPASDFQMIGIEVELAVRLARDLAPRSGAFTAGDIAAAIGTVHAAIEVVDTRIEDWQSAPALLKLADHQLNGAFVLGTGIQTWRDIELAQQEAVLTVNGVERARQCGSHPLGDPLAALPWLAAHAVRRTGGLRAGDVITTGTWLGIVQVAAGDSVTATFPEIGTVSVSFPAIY